MDFQIYYLGVAIALICACSKPVEQNRNFKIDSKGEISYAEGSISSEDLIDLHHEIIRTHEAHNIIEGEGVVVAVTDDGVDYNHSDLRMSIWNNIGEQGLDSIDLDKSLNGKDDDSNGYIDDFHGWDVLRNDNDPKPEYFFYRHGTFVAGVISANTLSQDGAIGIAPKAKIMAIKFVSGSRWSSEDVSQAYHYAVDNGARIINTSYDIDVYAHDQIFQNALNYAYQNGVLVINSAGNDNVKDPPRQVFDKLLLVTATGSGTNLDKLMPGANYGRGIDISAPGQARSTVPNGKYATLAGTSFAAAMVSGVAALIWSQHPEYTRDQVVAQLLGTTDSIDSINPLYFGQIGCGRINALKAVSNRPIPPRIENLHIGADRSKKILTVTIRGTLSPSSLTKGNIKILDPEGRTVPYTFEGQYFVGANEIRIGLPETHLNGQYEIFFQDVVDPFGQPAQIESSPVFIVD